MLSLVAAVIAAVGAVAVVVVPLVQDQVGPRGERRLMLAELEALAKMTPGSPAHQALEDVITQRASAWAELTTQAAWWGRRAVFAWMLVISLSFAAVLVMLWKVVSISGVPWYGIVVRLMGSAVVARSQR